MDKIAKFFHPSTLRELIRNVALGTLGLVAGTWFIALLTQYKVFDNPRGQVGDVASFFAYLISATWFQLLSVAVAAFAAGVWLDTYLVRRMANRWWHNVQAFTIRDAACLLADVKRGEFQKSDRALAIANELRGYINSGQMPLFLEMEFERVLPDFSDPKARYEPPYDRKEVDFEAVISKRTVESIARGRKWGLPWPIPPRDETSDQRPFPRPKPVPPAPRARSLADLLPSGGNALGKLAELAGVSTAPQVVEEVRLQDEPPPAPAPKPVQKPEPVVPRVTPLVEAERGACRAALIEIRDFLDGDIAALHRDLTKAAKSEKLQSLRLHIDRYRIRVEHARSAIKSLQRRHPVAVQRMGGPDLGKLSKSVFELQAKLAQTKEGISSGWPHDALMECVTPMQAKNLEIGRSIKRLVKTTEEKQAEFFG